MSGVEKGGGGYPRRDACSETEFSLAGASPPPSPPDTPLQGRPHAGRNGRSRSLSIRGGKICMRWLQPCSPTILISLCTPDYSPPASKANFRSKEPQYRASSDYAILTRHHRWAHQGLSKSSVLFHPYLCRTPALEDAWTRSCMSASTAR